MDADLEACDAWEPAEAARVFAGVEAPWYVAAGWAIGLFLGGKRREHEDLEVAVPRSRPPRLSVVERANLRARLARL